MAGQWLLVCLNSTNSGPGIAARAACSTGNWVCIRVNRFRNHIVKAINYSVNGRQVVLVPPQYLQTNKQTNKLSPCERSATRMCGWRIRLTINYNDGAPGFSIVFDVSYHFCSCVACIHAHSAILLKQCFTDGIDSWQYHRYLCDFENTGLLDDQRKCSVFDNNNNNNNNNNNKIKQD